MGIRGPKGIESVVEATLREVLTAEEFAQIQWSVEGADMWSLTVNISGPDEIARKAEDAVAD